VLLGHAFAGNRPTTIDVTLQGSEATMDDRWVFIAIPLGVGAIFVIGLVLTVGRALIRELIHGPPPPPHGDTANPTG
jgi:hypothetical protein